MWVNTELFRTEAKNFIKYGRYCDDPPGTAGFREYWDEQLRRCQEGYSVGGKRITGHHYGYLNFAKIMLTEEDGVEKVSKKKKRTGTKVSTFPDFWDGDYEYFWVVDIARHGIEENEYKKLGLGVNILKLDGGYHVVLAKARRKGFSYKTAWIATNIYNTIRKSAVVIGAFEKKYLYPKGTMTMVTSYMDFLNEHTAWTKRRQVVNRQDHRKASFLEKINGQDTEKGYQSEVIGVTFKDNPDAARGKDSNLVVFEEAGVFDNLKEAFKATEPSVTDGSLVTGQILIFGCVCAGTKVWTHDGREVNIEELTQENGIVGYGGKGVTLEPIVWMKPPAKKECVRIVTEGGATIECSVDHPLLVSKNHWRDSLKRKKVTFKRADSIKPGEQLMQIRQMPVFGNKRMWKPRLIGLLIGDGYYGKNSSPQVSVDSEGLDNWLNLELGTDLTLNKTKTQKNGRIYKYYTLKNTSPFLKEIGIYGQTWENKVLPENIHECDQYSISELLGGYFDADGSVYYNKTKNHIRVVLTSKYKHLLDAVKALLFKLGVGCSILEETRKSGCSPGKLFRLYISKQKDVIEFKKHIRFMSEHKQKQLDEYVEKNNGRYKYDDCQFELNPENNKGTYYTKPENNHLNNLTTHFVKSVEFIGEQDVYNLNAGFTHTYITNGFISGNTGGDMDGGTVDFEAMFYNPDPYNLIPIENIWDEGAQGTSSGYFFPQFKNLKGFYDKDGNSDLEGAKAFAEEVRANIKNTAKSAKVYDDYVIEYCFSPSEAFMQSNANIFPVTDLNAQRNLLIRDKTLGNLGVAGVLDEEGEEVVFKPSDSVRPITKFPHDTKDDTTGAVVIYQPPYKGIGGKVPDNVYLVAHDPYAMDTDGDKLSLGASYVIKRINEFSKPDDMIVATYVARPESQDDYNKNLFLLAKYYNAKIGFENDRGEVVPYAKRVGKTGMLLEEPELFDKTNNFRLKKMGRKYGISISSPERKSQGMVYLRDWLKSFRTRTEDGKPVFNYHYIYDIPTLEELIRYKPKGNFDRVSALIVGMYYLKAMANYEIEAPKEEYEEDFFDQAFFDD